MAALSCLPSTLLANQYQKSTSTSSPTHTTEKFIANSAPLTFQRKRMMKGPCARLGFEAKKRKNTRAFPHKASPFSCHWFAKEEEEVVAAKRARRKSSSPRSKSLNSTGRQQQNGME